MVMCAHDCLCEFCVLIKAYLHPAFCDDMKRIVEKYKRHTIPGYFPIEVVKSTDA